MMHRIFDLQPNTGRALRAALVTAATFWLALSIAPGAAEAATNPHGDSDATTSKCASCHIPHSAQSALLLSESTGAALCVSCHGAGSESDIASQLSASDLLTRHDILPGDQAAGGTVMCSSCHSPHRIGAESRYVDPDDRQVQPPSEIASTIDTSGQVYVLVGAAHDAVPPVLTGITLNSDADGTAPVVRWTTDEGATSWIDWGLSDSYELGNETTGTPFGNTLRVNAHLVQMSGLIPGTTYHYRVRSTDALGNRSVSADRVFTAFETIPEELSSAPASGDETITPQPSIEVSGSAEPAVPAAVTAGALSWLLAHDPVVLDTEYSVDTDRITLTLERRDGSRGVLSPSIGWESASAADARPTPSNPGSPVGDRLAAVADDDGTYLRTELAVSDREWNWQVLRFDLGAEDALALQRIVLAWNGHGEPTAGYGTELYLWDTVDGWTLISSREAGADTDITATRAAIPASLCLACHDGAAPADVIMPPEVTNIAATWAADVHGAGASTARTGGLLAPYARDGGPIDCSVCHDPHGSASIYHVPASVNGTEPATATTPAELRSLCSSCHTGTLTNWHAECVDCHSNGHWAGWVDPPVDRFLPTESSDCTSCHAHGASWTHPATCLRCHGTTELNALGATPDAPWTYERTF